MQRPVPDPEQPDINRVRALRTQTVRRGNHVVANGPAVAVRVDGDDLSVVVCFDLVPDVALVDLVAQAGNLIPRAGCAQWAWVVAWSPASPRPSYSPFQRRTATPCILPFCESPGQRRKAAHRDAGPETQ